MPSQLDTVDSTDLERLTREVIKRPTEVRDLINRLCNQRTVLQCGINRENEPRTARLMRIVDDRIAIETTKFDQRPDAQLYMNFQHNNSRYVFATVVLDRIDNSHVWVAIPDEIFRAERRDRYRQIEGRADDPEVRVSIKTRGGDLITGHVVNSSESGLGVDVPHPVPHSLNSELSLMFLDGSRSGESVPAKLQHVSRRAARSSEWIRIGLSLGGPASDRLIEIERRDFILQEDMMKRARRRMDVAGAAMRNAQEKLRSRSGSTSKWTEQVPIEKFTNARGDEIVAIVDHWGDLSQATAVIIPPAWGRTKETLLPLAMTIVESFRKAEMPVIVVRFDGTNRRGESYIEPGFSRPGDEYLRFTFSQATRDILATVDFLEKSTIYNPKSVILVTFSLASIEGRHAIALDVSGRIDGWVSAVGMTDLQSALRTISGGVDYAYGLPRGVRFGKHELVGVTADMDRTGLDAISNGMVYLDDARREMKSINIPITWIHGRDDAWIDISRARDILSCGPIESRKLIEVPTGHQLRTSRTAFATFQLIAEEVGKIVSGRRIAAVRPRLSDLSLRSKAEGERRPKRKVELRRFWEDYLLGRDRRIGMQLLTATDAYRKLMRSQIRALEISNGDRIADLGAGTGEFLNRLTADGGVPVGTIVHELDFVVDALKRSRTRHMSNGMTDCIRAHRTIANLNSSEFCSIPLRSQSFESVLASLLIGYVASPPSFLAEAFRVLRPGGRLVVSALRRDADISKLFMDGVQELRGSSIYDEYSGGSGGEFDRLVRDFLNDASHILDLEEEGKFRFWELDELTSIVSSAGFVEAKSWLDLGAPAQAIVISAIRPGVK